MSRNITFAVREGNALNTLPLGSTMIHFMDSDLTYFREQCIEIVRQYQNTGEYFPERVSVLKNYIRDCHPYCKVLLKTEFDKVVTDCIIEYLCKSEGIGMEELWVKTLSAADEFGQAVFHRISEYKIGYAINQWVNLLRIQSYAAAKMKFIFDGEAVSKAEYEARKLYFDMAFALSAQEFDCSAVELPQVRRYSVPLLPGSVAMLKNAVSSLEPVIKSMTGGRKFERCAKGRESLHDQAVAPAINAIIDLQRPMFSEITQLMNVYGNLPAEVYEPSCFKAIIDLEFDKLIEFGLLIKKSTSGNYIVVDRSDNVPLTDTMEVLEKEAEKKCDPETAPETDLEKIAFAEEEAAEVMPAPEEGPPASKEKIPDGMPDGFERIKIIRRMLEDPDRPLSKTRTPEEINQRCKLIWNDINRRIGQEIPEEEVREWFKSFVKIRYCIGAGKMMLEDLDKFLDATKDVYRIE